MNSENQDYVLNRIGFSSSLPLKVLSVGYSIRYNNIVYGPGNSVGPANFNSLGYSLNTSINRKKCMLMLDILFGANGFLNSALMNSYTLNMGYNFNNKARLRLYGVGNTMQSYDLTDYSLPFFKSDYYNARLLFSSRISSTLTYVVGPVFQYNGRLNNVSNSGFTRMFRGHSERLSILLNKRINDQYTLSTFCKFWYFKYQQRL